MKKIMIGIAFVIIASLLAGCTPAIVCGINPDADNCTIEYTPITNDTIGDVTSADKLEVVDVANDFDFTITELGTFDYVLNQDIPYVDVEEFLYVLQEGLMYYTVTKDLTMQITYTIPMGNIFNRYEYMMEIDPVENTIYLSDMGFGGSFNVSPNIDYQTDLGVVDNSYTEGVLEKMIDLDDYHLQIVEEDGVYFMPLYLANLFLTGDYLNVYETDNKLYIIDDFADAYDFLDNSVIDSALDSENILENTINFTSLFFDYFYGLKGFFGVDSYIDEFTEKGLYDVTTLEDYDRFMLQYIYGLDDLHTSIVDYGFNGELVTEQFSPDPDSKLRAFYDVYLSDACYLREDEFVFTEYDEYYILEINEFTLDTSTYLKDNLAVLDPNKPIFIDLACNAGGNLIAVLELLTYLTADPVTLRYQITSTDEIFSETYQLDESRALENDFYVFTSNMTYSAANLFTSMAKDQELATIIGTATSGGACSVLYSVMPNNMVITHSSDMAMLNQNNEIIEDGITPNDVLTYSLSLTDTLAFVYDYFHTAGEYIIYNNSTSSLVDIDLQCSQFPNDIEFQKFVLEVTDKETGEMYQMKMSETTRLDEQISLDSTYEQYHITIYAYYLYHGIEVREELLSRDVS